MNSFQTAVFVLVAAVDVDVDVCCLLSVVAEIAAAPPVCLIRMVAMVDKRSKESELLKDLIFACLNK